MSLPIAFSVGRCSGGTDGMPRYCSDSRDASRMKGLGSQETAEVIRQELEEPHAQVASIGMAGGPAADRSPLELEDGGHVKLDG